MVKSQRPGVPSDANLTGDHMVGGTPAFMAPEQVLGNRPLDGRTDVYAVGCLAYWLVTGQLVFPGPTAMETLMQHTYEVPVPPSRRTELQIPEALDQLILECLEKNPDGRPATADVLAERLATIQSTPAWTQARAQQWWDTHRPTANAAPIEAPRTPASSPAARQVQGR